MENSKDKGKSKYEENSNFENNKEDFNLENNLKETLLERLHSHDHDDIYKEIADKHSPEKPVEKSTLTKLMENIKPGLTVGLVNLPLSVSLAVASGATPTAGILSGIVSGFVTGLFGGSNYNIVGPTGALSGFLMSSVIRYGISILPLFSIFTGIFTFLTGYFKLQEFIDLVPVPVNEGFTLGVAFTIFFNQMNSALGIGKFKDAIPLLNKNNILSDNNLASNNNTILINYTIGNAANSTLINNNNPNDLYNIENLNAELYHKVVNILDSGNSESLVHNIIMNINHIHQMKWESFALYLAFFIVFLYLIMKHGKIPWMIISAILGIIISQFTSGRIETLQSKFGMLEFQFFDFKYLTDTKFNFFLKIFDIRIWIEALPIAFVAILETLISAKIADQITNTKFNKEAELASLGIANVLSGFLGGIPVTAALARTSLNINSGGTHRYSSLVSSFLMFSVSYFFMNYFSFIPMPVIAAQVCIVAVRLVNFEEIEHLYKHDKKNFYLFSIIVVISVVRDSIQAVLFGMLIYQIMFCKELTKPWTEIIKAKNLNSKELSVSDSMMLSGKASVISGFEGSNKKIVRSCVMGKGRNLEEFLNRNSCSNNQGKVKPGNNLLRNSEALKQIEESSFNERQSVIAIKDGIGESGYFKNLNFNNDNCNNINSNNNKNYYNNKNCEEFKETDKIDVIENPKKIVEENTYFNLDKQESHQAGNPSLSYKNFITQFEDVNNNNFFDIPKQEGNFIVYRIIGILNFMNVETHIGNINKLNLDPHSRIIISLRYVHLMDNEAVNSLENIIKTISENKENHFDEKDIKILISGITRNKLNFIKRSEFIQRLLLKNAILLAN